MKDVLLIEPYRSARSALATLLRGEGLEVVTCGRQRRALELSRRHRVDAIVTELVFHETRPCADFVRRLRRLHPNAAILVVSGLVGCHDLVRWGFDDPVPRAMRCGADACLPKPVDVRRLVHAIERGHPRQGGCRSVRRRGPQIRRDCSGCS